MSSAAAPQMSTVLMYISEARQEQGRNHTACAAPVPSHPCSSKLPLRPYSLQQALDGSLKALEGK